MASGYKGDFPVFPTKLSTVFVDKKKYAFDAKEFNPFAHPPSQKKRCNALIYGYFPKTATIPRLSPP